MFTNPLLKTIPKTYSGNLTATQRDLLNKYNLRKKSNVPSETRSTFGIDTETQQENIPEVIIYSRKKKPAPQQNHNKNKEVYYIITFLLLSYLVYKSL